MFLAPFFLFLVLGTGLGYIPKLAEYGHRQENSVDRKEQAEFEQKTRRSLWRNTYFELTACHIDMTKYYDLSRSNHIYVASREFEERFLTQDVLRDLLARMGKEWADTSYVDFPDNRLPLGVRSLDKELEEEQLFPLDYESLGESLHPSIRDQEFLEHSSLWGSQYMSGGAGEGKQRLRPEGSMKNKQEIKTDATLPAYCNPPNPCPLGYNSDNGCIEEFENTASFSRRYQASQECMCDSEHMFDCPNPVVDENENALDALNDVDFNRFLQHTMQVDPSLQHKNLVAKKFNLQTSPRLNPFLTGERLPVAAKKGHHVVY